MAEFVNTVDVLGDDVTAAAILDRSITEFSDDILKNIPNSVFYSCGALTMIDLPSVTSIRVNAFRNCGNLQIARLISATVIETSAFESCGKLRYVELGAANLGQWAFYGCGIKALVMRHEGSCPGLNAQTFQATAIASGTGYIYVPRSMVEQYKAATNWSAYAGQIRALEDYTVDGTVTGELYLDEV